MTPGESMDQWLARIGSKKAMEERQAARLAGTLNPILKGPKGLATLVKLMRKRPEREAAPQPASFLDGL